MQFTLGKEDIVLYYRYIVFVKLMKTKKKSIKENILDRKVLYS